MLLVQSPTPAHMYDALAAQGGLSRKGLARKAEVIALITDITSKFDTSARDQPMRVGPTVTDCIARDLSSSGFLSVRGKRMNQIGGAEPRA